MNRHCTQCKNFVQHYFINEWLRLSDIYKMGHCQKGMIKDGKLKICKEWVKSDQAYKVKEKYTIESTVNRIHTQLDELLLVYRALTKESAKKKEIGE